MDNNMAYTTLTQRRGHREDKKQKIMMALIPILAIILVVVVSMSFRKPSPAESKAGSSITQPRTIPDSSRIQWTPPALYEANFPDPMRLEASPVIVVKKNIRGNTILSDSEQTLNILGIIYADRSPAVLIGTDIYLEGDVVAGIKIVRILEDKVIVEQGGKQWEQTIITEP
jgi:hypothetical protein